MSYYYIILLYIRKEKEKIDSIQNRKLLFSQKYNIQHSKETDQSKSTQLISIDKKIEQNQINILGINNLNNLSLSNSLNTANDINNSNIITETSTINTDVTDQSNLQSNLSRTGTDLEMRAIDKFKDDIDLKKQKIKESILQRSNEYIKSSGVRMQGILSTIDVVRNRFKDFGAIQEESLDAMKENVKKSAKVEEFLAKMDNKINSYTTEALNVINETEEMEHTATEMENLVNQSTTSLTNKNLNNLHNNSGLNLLKDFSKSSKNNEGSYEIKNQKFGDLREFSKILSESRGDDAISIAPLNESRLLDDNESRLESEIGVTERTESRIERKYGKGRNQFLSAASETTQSIQSFPFQLQYVPFPQSR